MSGGPVALRVCPDAHPSWCEELSERCEHCCTCYCPDPPQPTHQSDLVHCANLVQGDLTIFFLEAARHARWVRTGARRHRRDDDRRNMTIHLVGRDDQAWPCFLDLTTDRRVETGQVDVEPLNYHCHS